MTSTPLPNNAEPAPPKLALSRAPRAALAAIPQPDDSAEPIRFATLCADERLDDLVRHVQTFAASISASIDSTSIPAQLARGGTVGRIGVPQVASALMLRQQVVVGTSVGADPLAPVSRLWRGLQRRADVLLDMRQCTTLPGSVASLAGVEREVLLVSQRVLERTTSRLPTPDENTAADQWTRARESADIVYRLAVAEQRDVLLVLPVGRSTDVQRLFSDALARQARQHRMTPPRTVKAGLLSALLTGDTGRERWLVASVMPIDDLVSTAADAVGDTGPWPVISLGRSAVFCGMPELHPQSVDPVPMLLVLEYLMRRAGQAEKSRLLLQSVRTTMAALHRTREEFGAPFEMSPRDFLQAALSNWGRVSPADVMRERRAMPRVGPVVSGLRLRIESPLSATDLRAAVSASLVPAGLEVASVRSMDTPVGPASAVFDVRVRSGLGEPPLSDEAASALVRALGASVRCVAVEPWIPGGTPDRARVRTGWRADGVPAVS
jgi:hypothetical protein